MLPIGLPYVRCMPNGPAVCWSCDTPSRSCANIARFTMAHTIIFGMIGSMLPSATCASTSGARRRTTADAYASSCSAVALALASDASNPGQYVERSSTDANGSIRPSPGYALRSGTARVGDLHEVLSVTVDEPEVRGHLDGEHFALPKVDLIAALVHGRLSRNLDTDVLHDAVHRLRPVASEADDVRLALLVDVRRTERRHAEQRGDGAVRLDVVHHQRTLVGVLRAQQDAASLRREHVPVQ